MGSSRRRDYEVTGPDGQTRHLISMRNLTHARYIQIPGIGEWVMTTYASEKAAWTGAGDYPVWESLPRIVVPITEVPR